MREYPYEFREVKITKKKFSEMITYLFYDESLFYEKKNKESVPVKLWTIKNIGHPGKGMLIIGKLEIIEV